MEKNVEFSYKPDFDFVNLDESLFAFAEPVKITEEQMQTPAPYNYWGSVGKTLSKRKGFVLAIIFSIIYILCLFIIPAGHTLTVTSVVDYSSARTSFVDHNVYKDNYWMLIWFASRGTAEFVFFSLGIQMFFGFTIGLLWGYRLLNDRILSWFAKVFWFVPRAIFWSTIIYLFSFANFEHNFWISVFTISLTSWIPMSSQVKEKIRSARLANMHNSSRSMGTSNWKIFHRDVLPDILPVMFKTFSVAVPEIIAADSTMSFFGLSFIKDGDKHHSSLGYILHDAIDHHVWREYPFALIAPIVIILCVSLLTYYISKILSQSLDSRNHSR